MAKNTFSQRKKLLFICSRNQWRSPTAEKVYNQKGFDTRSAGTSPSAKRTVSANDVRWADCIFVMEKKHKQKLSATFARLLEHKKLSLIHIYAADE